MSEDQNTTSTSAVNPLAARIQAVLDDLGITGDGISVRASVYAWDLDVCGGLSVAHDLGLDNPQVHQSGTSRWIKGTASDGSGVQIFISTGPGAVGAASTQTGRTPAPAAPDKEVS